MQGYRAQPSPERSPGWLVCLLLSFSLLLFASAPGHAQAPASAIVLLDLTQAPAELRDRLRSFDALRALAWLKIDRTTPPQTVVDTLGTLADASRSAPLVAGIGLESARPLLRMEIDALSAYAARSSFVSAKFEAADAADWEILFAAQARNSRLITTVYGAAAIRQISLTPSLAQAFAATRVPVVHVFAQPQGPDEAARRFWRDVGGRLQSSPSEMTVLVLDPGDSAQSDWTEAVLDSTGAAPERLYWVGGTDLRRFKPATLTSTSLTAWSVQRDGARRRGYDRKNSPAGLYQAMGPSQAAFAVLASMIERVQQANRQSVYFLADSENNLHTFRFLADVAATTLCKATECVGPFAVTSDAPAQSNVLLGPGSAGPFAAYAGSTQLDIARPPATTTMLFCYACGFDRAPPGRGTPFKFAEF